VIPYRKIPKFEDVENPVEFLGKLEPCLVKRGSAFRTPPLAPLIRL